jgi:glycosyltransferase involved in cell wall biosynthesis
MTISVLILTLNEADNVGDAIKSVSGSDDIVIFDSFSSDDTVSIATANGARVVQRKFDNYASQRNAALDQVHFKYQWILMLDADERCTPDLWAEMHHRIRTAPPRLSLFRMRRKDYFMGKWLKRSSGYPTWFGRLMCVGEVRVEREINEEYVTDGEIGYLNEHLIHFPFNRGLEYWFERHNRYSTMEARKLIEESNYAWSPTDVFSGDPTSRRRAMKQFAYRLPFRPFLVFCYLYIFRMGALDGIAGLRFCRMRAMYEYMIDLKAAEILSDAPKEFKQTDD